jgi:hypothetical protein
MPSTTLCARRASLQSPLWSDANAWRLWSWCVLSVARKAQIIHMNSVPVRLAAGQVAAPLEVICAQTGLPQNALCKALTVGKILGVYVVRPLPWGLVIIIVEWQEVSRRIPVLLQ